MKTYALTIKIRAKKPKNVRNCESAVSFHVFRSVRDPRLFFVHSRWADEAAFQNHAVLEHTERFLKKVDALVDQPREVTRTEMIA